MRAGYKNTRDHNISSPRLEKTTAAVYRAYKVS